MSNSSKNGSGRARTASGQIPQGLIDQVREGNCVAFVGAGFSAPAIGGWADLLIGLAESSEIDDEIRSRVHGLVRDKRPSSRDLEAAAQIIGDALGDENLALELNKAVPTPPLDKRMRRRIELLQNIPFRSVLTTNFDGLLPGHAPGREAYQKVLRPSDHRWWNERHWNPKHAGRDVVHLHGSVNDPNGVDDIDALKRIVFTRQDYRRRIHATPGYTTFLRSVMATTTVLYLGFSFTDAYLDELRSEILSLLEYRRNDKPIAYALVNDASDDEIAYARQHEGIEVVSYPSEPDDFKQFDHLLTDLHRETNPTNLLGELLTGKRIVWIDPARDSVEPGMAFLKRAASTGSGRTKIKLFDNVETALNSVAKKGADLVITRWGHGLGPSGGSTAAQVLSEVRRRNIRSPVVVFASGHYPDDNKRHALTLGATAFEFKWDGLFREIERLFTPGSKQP